MQEKGSRLSVARKAMGGEFEILFDSRIYPQGTEASLAALDEIERLDAKLSVFQSDSMTQYVNRVAAFNPVSVDEEFFSLLETALSIHKRTDGAFDITSTPLWRLWGFAKRNGRIPDDAEIQSALQTVGSEYVQLDAENLTVHFLKQGLEINFGAIGKGYAVDRAVKILHDWEMSNFLLHGDRSSVFASGGPHNLGIADPLHFGKRIEEITLKDAAMGTSGSQQQFFRYRGKRYGHILNPKSGYPAEGTLLATVIAKTAVLADAFSTAFFVLGAEKAEAMCTPESGLSVFIVSENGYNNFCT